ncbi:MAG: DUF1800 domain-containing protein, partial [Actinomycetota bacterium]|nr:DUF1800 domain-containing protein [Actinomycetota bacterium]
SRRAALLAAGAATMGTIGIAAARNEWDLHWSVPEAGALGGTVPTSLDILDPDPVLHLVRRATFGQTPELLAEVGKRGVTQWLDDQLHPDRIDDPVHALIGRLYPLLAASAAQLRGAIPADDPLLAVQQLIEATMIRQIWSSRQLSEVMVDFWSNHFNVTTALALTRTTKPVEDRTVIRRHALGRFEDLLLADAKSPAMLVHLGNYVSRGDEPNENYGRELLELHTVGTGAGYTEDDVRNSAYVLTGWGVDDKEEFRFLPAEHYIGPVQILGWSARNGDPDEGVAVGEDYLRYLARHEHTARHLSYKLAVRFVSDDPPESLVTRLAESYLSGGTAIVPWLHTLFSSTEFAESVGRKVRRPLEDLVAAVRALGIRPPSGPDTAGVWELVVLSKALGQSPLGAAEPTGYADVAADWLSTSGALGRWNIHRHVIDQGVTGLQGPGLDDLLSGRAPQDMGAFVDRLTTRVTGQVVRHDHRAALLAFLGVSESGAYDDRILSRSLRGVVALILDSPYHLLR